MLRYFQSGYLSRYIVIIFLALLLWIPAFILQKDFSEPTTPFYQLIIWLFGNNYYVLTTLAFILTLFSALIINNICSDTGISSKITTLGVFLFILISSSLPQFTIMSPFIWVNFLLLFLLKLIYFLPNTNNQNVLAYNAGFIVGIGSLFYSYFILFLVVIWISFRIHRANSWRIYLAALIGAFTPILFILTWYFWNDQTLAFLQYWTEIIYLSDFSSFLQMGVLNMIILILLFSLIIFSIFKTFFNLWEKNINLRRNLKISMYLFIFSVFIVLLNGKTASIQIVVLPASIILIHAFSSFKSSRFINILLTVFLILILTNQYLIFLF